MDGELDCDCWVKGGVEVGRIFRKGRRVLILRTGRGGYARTVFKEIMRIKRYVMKK